jgi:hypothetical protein
MGIKSVLKGVLMYGGVGDTIDKSKENNRHSLH